MTKEQRYLDEYFSTDSERKWKIQNYIRGLPIGELFNLYIERKINHKDMTARKYLLNSEVKNERDKV